MAVIDSRTAGVLTPVESSNTSDPTNTIRSWVAQITSIPLDHVRRRWLPKPGTRPGVDENWCAVGFESVETHGNPDQIDRKGDLEKPESGDVLRVSHQTFRFVASFYGPSAALNADLFREGSQVFQNLRWLEKFGLKLQGFDGQVQRLPDLLYEQWVDRCDVRFSVGRAVRRTFGIRDLCAVGDIQIKTDSHSED